jgi:hypothetical protein
MLISLSADEIVHKIKRLCYFCLLPVKPPKPAEIVGQVFGGDPVKTPDPAFESLVIIIHALDMECRLFNALTITGVEYFVFEVMLTGKGLKGQMTIGAEDDIPI